MIKFLLIVISLFALLGKNSFAQKEDILPVQLIYFQSQIFSNGVILRWGTATEVNNLGFEVQRASVPYQFVTIDFVPGHGNSNSPKHYIYVDSTLPNYGVYYYRLKQIDIDGTLHYSDTLTVNYFPLSVENSNNVNSNNSFVHNNFSINQLTIYLSEKINDQITASIFSITGEKVKELVLSNPTNPFLIHYKNLPNGIYIITLNSNKKFLLSQKFMVLK